MSKFKIGVSNWKLIFDGGEVIEIRTLSKESITYKSNGDIAIKLVDVAFEEELSDLFKVGNNIDKVIQNFKIADQESHMEDVTWEYENLTISSININSETDAVGTTSIVLKSNKIKENN